MGVPWGEVPHASPVSLLPTLCPHFSFTIRSPQTLQSSGILPFPRLHTPCLGNQTVRPLPVHTLGLIPYQLEQHRAPLCLHEPLSPGPRCRDWPSWGGSGLCLCVERQQFWASLPGSARTRSLFLHTPLGPAKSPEAPLLPWVIFSACSSSSPAGAPFLSALVLVLICGGPRPRFCLSPLGGRGKDRSSASRLCHL